MKSTKHVATLAVLTATALCLSWLENALGFNVGVPGLKIGYANIVCLFALYRYGGKDALAVSLMRVLLVALLFGSAYSAIYSTVGALSSLAVMCALKKTKLFGVCGVSIAAACTHNIAQLATAAVLGGTAYVFSYAPTLIIGGTVFGAAVGAVCAIMLKRIPKSRNF